MGGSAPQQHGQPAGGASPPAGAFEPAVALCRGGEIVWASDRFAELLGREPAPVLPGQRLTELLAQSGEEVEVPDAARSMTYRIVGRDGDAERIVRLNQFEVPSEDTANAVELWLLRDATVEAEVSRLNRALERSGAQLENVRKELNQDRDELIALLSHELRIPLTVISGYNKLLLSERVGKLSDEQRHYLEESRNSCQRLNEFVADLLDAPHDRSGALTLSLEERSVVPSIRAVIEFFLPLLEEKSLEAEIDLPGELPLGRLDPARIEQVLTNLLGNAVKYTKFGSVISVGARVVSGDRGPMIEVSITDDGPGIAAEDSQRIFEPFVRGTGERRDGGVGLGLAICRRILEAHAGEIWVEAASGRGSRFVFSIPAVLQGSQAGR